MSSNGENDDGMPPNFHDTSHGDMASGFTAGLLSEVLLGTVDFRLTLCHTLYQLSRPIMRLYSSSTGTSETGAMGGSSANPPFDLSAAAASDPDIQRLQGERVVLSYISTCEMRVE